MVAQQVYCSRLVTDTCYINLVRAILCYITKFLEHIIELCSGSKFILGNTIYYGCYGKLFVCSSEAAAGLCLGIETLQCCCTSRIVPTKQSNVESLV